jgi:hypothetical protein
MKQMEWRGSEVIWPHGGGHGGAVAVAEKDGGDGDSSGSVEWRWWVKLVRNRVANPWTR